MKKERSEHPNYDKHIKRLIAEQGEMNQLDEQKQCAKEILDYIKACEIDGQEPDQRDIVTILNKHFGYNP